MIAQIRFFLKKQILKARKKDVISKITFQGEKIEVTSGTIINHFFGSTKEDIIISNNVKLMNCSISSSNHGKILIAENVSIGAGTSIRSVDSVVIGKNTMVSYNVVITDNNNHPVSPSFREYVELTPHGSECRSWVHSEHDEICIGANCWIGENSRIQKGVHIGDNSIVAASAVVTKDVPPNSIAAGNPARIVKENIDKIPAPNTCKEYNDYISTSLK